MMLKTIVLVVVFSVSVFGLLQATVDEEGETIYRVNGRITGAHLPVDGYDVATKDYVDASSVFGGTGSQVSAMNFRDISIDRSKSHIVCGPDPAIAGEWINCSVYTQNAADALAGVPDDERLMWTQMEQLGVHFFALDNTPTSFVYTYEDATYKVGFKTSLAEELSIVFYYYHLPFVGGSPLLHSVIPNVIDPNTLVMDCVDTMQNGKWQCDVTAHDIYGNLAGIEEDVSDFVLLHTLDGMTQSIPGGLSFVQTGLFRFTPEILKKGMHNFTIEYMGKMLSYPIYLSLEFQCPPGFTTVESQDSVMGCLSDTVESSMVPYLAARNCWTKYGGRLPNMQEMMAASVVMTLPVQNLWLDQTDRSYTTAWVDHQAIFKGPNAIPAANGATYTSSQPSRCWIPAGQHKSVFACPSSDWVMLVPPSTHSYPLGCIQKTVQSGLALNAMATCHDYGGRLPSFSELMIAQTTGEIVEADTTYVLENYLGRVYTGSEYTFRTGRTRPSDGMPSAVVHTSAYSYRCFLPTFDIENPLVCEPGWNPLISNGTNVIACMQDTSHPDVSTKAAFQDCFASYGASLPSFAEIRMAVEGGTWSIASGDRMLTYHVNRFYTSTTYYRVISYDGNSVLSTTSVNDRDWDTHVEEYRCVKRR